MQQHNLAQVQYTLDMKQILLCGYEELIPQDYEEKNIDHVQKKCIQ